MTKRLSAILLVLSLLTFGSAGTAFHPAWAAPAPARVISAAERSAAERITAAQLKDDLYYVASDEMQGRDTPSPGLDTTARFIAGNLKRWGIKPKGDDDTYFQKITLKRDKIDPDHTSVQFNGKTYKYGDDFLVGRSGGNATGAMVYVGNGWLIKSRNMDPYSALDVRGKIMIVAGSGLPHGLSPSDLTGGRGVDWSDPATYGYEHGAIGMLVIPRVREIEQWWNARRKSLARGFFQPEQFTRDEAPRIPAITPSATMLDAIFAGEHVSGAEILKAMATDAAIPSFNLADSKKLVMNVGLISDVATTQNVVGVLEGSDPVLRNEYVAIGAHYDHLGVGVPVNGDAIYNGADDDGSGTVSELSIANAFAHGARPKRSILFVWHCGEEKGLWGSRYFTTHPTVPLDHIVTQLNIDMIGRSRKAGDTKPANRELTGPDEIYVIGSKMMSTGLGELSEEVNKSYLNLKLNYKYDDPSDPNRFFFRSDHYNYAQKGIPIIFYFDGVHEDYHRPSDSPDKIDYQKMQKVARTIFLTASEIANASARPVVDKKLPAELSGE